MAPRNRFWQLFFILFQWWKLKLSIRSESCDNIDGLMQERHNSIAHALEFHLSCTNPSIFNTLRLRKNGRHFADNPFKRIFLNETLRISIKISLKFVPRGPINNIPALVQIMAWRRRGNKPLSEPMMVSLLTHICVTGPQWVNIMPMA